jgi:hypothetical protein
MVAGKPRDSKRKVKQKTNGMHNVHNGGIPSRSCQRGEIFDGVRFWLDPRPDLLNPAVRTDQESDPVCADALPQSLRPKREKAAEKALESKGEL